MTRVYPARTPAKGVIQGFPRCQQRVFGRMISTMLPFTIPTTTAAEERAHLEQLRAERALTADAILLEDIDAEIVAATGTYVGLAVTEIATLRGEIAGRQQG
jgi:hypothetical protein